MATPKNQPPRSRPTAATDQPAETPSRGEVTAAQEVQRVEHVVLRAADGGQRGDSHGDEDAPQPHADALTCAVEARHAPGDVAAEEVSDGEHDEQRDPAGEADGLRLRAVTLLARPKANSCAAVDIAEVSRFSYSCRLIGHAGPARASAGPGIARGPERRPRPTRGRCAGSPSRPPVTPGGRTTACDRHMVRRDVVGHNAVPGRSPVPPR